MTKLDTTGTIGTTEIIDSSIAIPFWLLKTGTAKKLGKQADGGISYEILTDSKRLEPLVKIIGNDGGGYFSKETLSFKDIEACIGHHPQGQALPSKLLQAAFTGRSSNNAGFLAAILRAEGLLALAPDTEGRHIVSGDWAGWKASLLAEPGQPIDIVAATPAEVYPSESQGEPAQGDRNKAPTPRRGKKIVSQCATNQGIVACP